ncbi:hypothetical protein V1527DRAFT_477998 [Lipomyces starkeyi]
MWGFYIPKIWIVPIIVALLFLLEQVSAYTHGTLCISAVFHTYDTYFEGSIQTVLEEDGLLVYQADGVDLSQVLRPDDLLIDDLDGSANVRTIFKVGRHVCTLHGQWSSQGDIPPSIPHVTSITCPGSDRVWHITSSDAAYKSVILIGNTNPPNPMDFYMNGYNLFGKYCGSY